jgi:very-short-patch-repair endonuclease
MRLEGSEYGKRNAKRLRKEMTPPEIGLWLALRQNDARLHFRKQHAVDDYVLDFYCARAKLAVEVDGEAHSCGDRPERDAVRDAWLASQGLMVLRYSATEALTNLDGVVRQVISIAIERSGHFEK